MIPVTLLTITLAGCGGGGGSGDSDSGGEAIRLEPGAFNTTIQFDGGEIADAITLLSSSGKFVTAVIDDDDVTLGNISFSAPNTLSGTGSNVFFSSGYQSVQGQLNGTVSSPERATIDVTAPGYASVTTLVRDNSFSDAGAQFSQINDTFTDVVGGITTSVTVASDGTITGSDTTGCVINGTASIPDPQYNVFDIEVTASNCGEISGGATASQRNGDYSALGAYNQSSDELVVGGTNGEVTLIFFGTK